MGMGVDAEAFLLAARSAQALIADPAVARAWRQPSSLAGFSVGGLAAHLGGQVLMVAAAVTTDPPQLEQVTALEHYARAQWVDTEIDGEVNLAIRELGEDAASGGHAALLARVEAALSTLESDLPGLAPERGLPTPAGAWALPLPEALLTRVMEIAVHSDDLAVSVGRPTPTLPDAVIHPVLALLAALAARRHGQPAVLRALTRAERTEGSITAFGPDR